MGLGPAFSPPEAGLAQHPVGRLPLPLDRPQLVAFLDQDGPDLLEDPVLAPALEPAVDRAVIAEVLGELVPLAAGAEAKDDPVDRRPPVDPGATPIAFGSRWCVLQEDRLDALPEGIADLPDSLRRFGRFPCPRQGRVS